MSSNDLAPEYALMGFLYFQPLHGYDLHRRLQANLSEVWHISQSQAYSILKRLEARELVRADRQHQEKRPDRECFSLTDAGRARFDSWLNMPTRATVRAVRVEFITRLFFASQISEDSASRLLQEQAAATREHIQALQNRLASIPDVQLYNHLGLELRIRQMSAFLEWLETCELKLAE